MIQNLLFALWFLLPAGLANMAPVIVAKAPLLKTYNVPLDFGKSYRGKRIFGDHKTWRGLLSGMVISTIVFIFQIYAYQHYGWAQDISLDIDYATMPLILGPLLGFGALVGDAIESFFKRRSNVAPGEAWIPFDQIDYIIGAILISLPFAVLSLVQYVCIFIVWFGMHLLSSFIGWKLGLKDAPI